MKVGIDNYGLFPLGLGVFETLQWAVDHQAEGVAFSGLMERTEQKLDAPILNNIRNFAKSNNLYLEWGGGQHLPWDIANNKRKEIIRFNTIVCQEASELGVSIVRSCSGGLMRWNPKGPGTDEYLQAMAKELKKLHPVLKDLGIVWAIETHFEFTSFELVRFFEENSFYPGEEIGICLDTMNLLTMLEDPLEATKRLIPWIVSTHVKDGGVLTEKDGLMSFPAGIGEGWIPLEAIVDLLSRHDDNLHLNVEDHNGSFLLPVNEKEFLKEFPDLKEKELHYLMEMADSAETSRSRIEKEFLDRSIWPAICAMRMDKGISELKKIRNIFQHAK